MATNDNKLRKHFQDLCHEIERHNKLYYQDCRPEITDFEYDCLQAEKQAIATAHPDWLKQEEGPGSDLTKAFPRAKHLSPMLSLSNTYNYLELEDFYQHLEQKQCILEPKVDGLAINLLYRNHQLDKAITRGDGKEGEVVTENILTIPQIPQRLPENTPSILEVRGEVYLTTEQFQKINALQESLGEETFANARNLAAGSLKLLNVEEVRERGLQFISHGIGFTDQPEKFPTQASTYTQLQQWGFPTFQQLAVRENLTDIWDYIQYFHSIKKDLAYGTDGVVVKLNDRKLQAQMGQTAKSPRWAIAYKFEPESAETLLKDVTFQVGRTGVITPVAELQPVNLAGSCISRATLHNFEEVQRKDVRKGDTVIVQKAGEVIPAIVGVNLSKRPENALKIEIPRYCPVCHSELIKVDGEVAIRCPSLQCPPQILLKIRHFVEALDIEGMGPKVIETLIQQNWIKNFADIFQLYQKKTLWLQLPGYSNTSIDKLLTNIELAKKAELWRYIYGIGFPNVGIEIAKKIADHYTTLENLFVCNELELQRIDLVGPIVAKEIKKFLENPHNKLVLNKLQTSQIQPTAPIKIQGPWYQKKFVFTGTLSIPRAQAQQYIENLGGQCSSSISAKITALIVGQDPGDKLAKAQKLNIPCWDEEQFMQQVKQYAH